MWNGKRGGFPRQLYQTALPAHRPSGCAHPPVWPAGGPGLLSGQGLGPQRPHLRQPVRPGGAGADRLRPGPRSRRSAAAAGGGLPRQRPHHQRPGAGKDPLRPAAPVRGGVPALPRTWTAGGSRPWPTWRRTSSISAGMLPALGLCAFVADGSILPRASGVSSLPMKGAVPFRSPRELVGHPGAAPPGGHSPAWASPRGSL